MNSTLKIEQEQQYKHLINRNKVIVIFKNGQKSVLWKGQPNFGDTDQGERNQA